VIVLPDGHSLLLGSETFRCGEALFKPGLLGLELPGIHQLIYQSIMKCGVDERKELCGNILVSGGTTLLPGFVERLKSELEKLLTTMPIKIISNEDRINDVWIGGSIYEEYTGQREWISNEEYDECGPAIVHRKFPA